MLSGGLSDALQCEVMLLGSVTRALALFHIHWYMKLGEEQGAPLSWLCPLTADGSLEGPGEVCGSGHGLR